jgi:hypothetical protein
MCNFRWVVTLGIVLAFTACDSKNAPVRVWGDVTFDGEKVETGTIEFNPIDGTKGPQTGGTIKAGRYDVSAGVGPVAGGTYLMRITATAKTGKTTSNPAAPAGPPVEVLKMYIPAQYNTKSTLKVTISPQASANKFDFALTSKPAGAGPAKAAP